MSQLLRVVMVFAAAGVVGCGDAAMAPVTGVVTMDGKPVADAIVVFQPQPADGEPYASTTRAMARTDAGGVYQLSTIDRHDGAAVGTHKVSIASNEKFGKPVGVLPANFTVEVKSGANTIDLQIEPVE